MYATKSHNVRSTQMKKLKMALASHWKKSTTILLTSLPLNPPPPGSPTS
ncbi:hypothetical protein DFR69_11090 [Nocardia neocaledoniensis]|uniref:Uncharacterized protein n=1 Tax=Nocardia neocaledoniensis TaxID=236511 RepID=A0A317N8F1_9NOCA|nr:hypothetical protein DFR69_11090 [Nocardia neocaledoniensis]